MVPGYQPSVSIVIPCFNEEEWIEKTIRGCLNQHYPEDRLEVILVDDGSTDATAGIVRGRIARVARVRLLAAPALPPYPALTKTFSPS